MTLTKEEPLVYAILKKVEVDLPFIPITNRMSGSLLTWFSLLVEVRPVPTTGSLH